MSSARKVWCWTLAIGISVIFITVSPQLGVALLGYLWIAVAWNDFDALALAFVGLATVGLVLGEPWRWDDPDQMQIRDLIGGAVMVAGYAGALWRLVGQRTKLTLHRQIPDDARGDDQGE
jgi:hypothetical protein